jgi:chromosome segregation ATPase
VITIGYGASEPALAREVVSAFLDAAETYHQTTFSTNKALEFVKSRFQESQKDEQDTSTAFSEYRSNCGVTDYETQRVAVMAEVNELEKAKATDAQKLETLRSKKRVVAEQIDGVKPMIPQTIATAPLQNPDWTALKTRVNALQDQLEDLPSRPGGTTAEREAQRASLQNRIDRARAELDRTQTWIPQEPTIQSTPNPEWLRLKQDVDQTEQQLAEQEAIVAKSEERLKFAQDRLKNIETCAPRYKLLEGEYLAAKSNKESMAQAFERAQTANLLEQLQFSNLRRIQDASLPYEKDGPKRSKFVLIA